MLDYVNVNTLWMVPTGWFTSLIIWSLDRTPVQRIYLERTGRGYLRR